MKTQSKKRKVPYGMAREDIAAAARELFYEKGLATGLDEILKRADVSKPTFYHHFGSKEELESQYLTAQAEFLRTSVDRIAGKSREASQFIRRWMEFIRRRASSPTFVGCPLGNFAIEAKSAHNARVLREFGLSIEKLEDTFKAKGIQATRARELAPLIFMIYEGALLMCSATEERSHLSRATELMVRLVREKKSPTLK